MNRFFDPQTGDAPSDKRLFAPATARNRDAILDILKLHHPGTGTLLEIASGTGEHAAHMASHFPDCHWQPSDIDPEKIASIDAWRTGSAAAEILPAMQLDILADDLNDLEVPAPISTIMAVNLIHIAPWGVAKLLIEKSAATLPPEGVLFLYGPYKRDGVHTAPSNESFDLSLRARDADWGVRDLEAVSALAQQAGFGAPTVIEMPANNLSVVFRKA